MNKIIVSLAPMAISIPLQTGDLVNDVKKSVEAGAAMCHLHSRTENGDLSPDTSYMVECFERIRQEIDVIIQVSSGGVSSMTIEERCNPLDYEKAETASLNGGSINLGEVVYKNSFKDIRYCTQAVYDRNIFPEIEVFDISMIHNIELVAKNFPFRQPILYNLVFGHQGGIQANIKSLIAFQSFIPQDALWGITHYGRDNWTFLAAAIAMGASLVRIGFEDSFYLSPGTKASYNYQLVEKLVQLIKSMGLDVVTPEQARSLLGLTKLR